MHEAMLYEKLSNSRVRCNTCQWRCTISQGKSGVCKMYRNNDGALYNMNYASFDDIPDEMLEAAAPAGQAT